MLWKKHPKYIEAKEGFIADFKPSYLNNLNHSLPKVVFICGGEDETCKNRSILEKYFLTKTDKYLTFRAEHAWDVISKTLKHENALALEEWLAEFSDAVIILVESFGTVAELGAFSLSPKLRKKTLAILDKQYELHESFVNTGPVKWIDAESRFKPCIYADPAAILTATPDIFDRLERGTKNRIAKDRVYGNHKLTAKEVLFLILHIVTSLGPISADEVRDVVNKLSGFNKEQDIRFFLSIGKAIGIFETVGADKDILYYCFDFEKFFKSPNTQKLLHRIQLNRARSLSHLLHIEAFKGAMIQVRKDVA